MISRGGLAGVFVGAALAAAAARGQTSATMAPTPPTTTEEQSTSTAPPIQPPPPQPAAPLPAVPPPNRISFELKVPQEKGGGTIAGTAGSIQSTGQEEAELTGGFEVHYKDMVLTADHATLHRDTMTLEAEGDVVVDQSTRRLTATRADYDLATEKGTFWNATAFAEPDQYFSGKVITKTGEDTFEVEDGMLTSCTGDRTPDWSVRVSHARVRVGGYAHLVNSRMRVKKLPVFYWPYLVWPVKTERSSGFLIPNVGYSASRGAYLGLAYYQVLGRSADLTFHLDGYENTYDGAGAELRYAPIENTKGNALFYSLENRDTGQREWRGIWNHTEELGGGLKAVVTYNNYSDYNFFREFQSTEGENTRSFLYSNAFLNGNWGAQSFSTLIDERKSFVSATKTTTARQLPRINYQVSKVKLWSLPLYFSADSTANYIQSTSTVGTADISYGRVDLDPSLTLPLRVAPWLSVSLTGGERGTWWGDSVPQTRVDPLTGVSERVCGDRVVPADQVYCGESLTRVYPTGDVQMVGPSFSKIFESPGGRFSKFKHVIEPRWSYDYIGQFDDQNRVIRFDQIDGLSSTQLGTFALVNRVLAKPTDENEGGAFEIFSFQLSQSYSFDSAQPLQRSRDGKLTSAEGPIVAQLRFNPSKIIDLQARANWSTLFKGLQSTSLTLSADGTRAGVDVTWYTNYNAETAEKSSDQARFGFKLDILPNRLRLSGQVNYDILNDYILQDNFAIAYTSQCWGIVLMARQQTTSTLVTKDYRFLLNLKNVGTFLDLGTGQSTTNRF
jgi:LPS-assembly protein